MPEHDVNKERTLGGETVVPPSSDEAIRATLEELTREIQGLSNPPVVLEGQPLAPVSNLSEAQETEVTGVTLPGVVSRRRTEAPADSVTGFGLYQGRLQKRARRKAA